MGLYQKISYNALGRYTDQPFLANSKSHDGRGIAGKVVFPTWLTCLGPRISFLLVP